MQASRLSSVQDLRRKLESGGERSPEDSFNAAIRERDRVDLLDWAQAEYWRGAL